MREFRINSFDDIRRYVDAAQSIPELADLSDRVDAMFFKGELQLTDEHWIEFTRILKEKAICQ